MTLLPSTPIWARSDGSHVARGWHRGLIVGRYQGGYIVELLEYAREFKARAESVRVRKGSNDTDLPTTWAAVPWRPDREWRPTRRAGT